MYILICLNTGYVLSLLSIRRSKFTDYRDDDDDDDVGHTNE